MYAQENYIGKGVSVCATCDGFFYKKKTVCVIGGGNTAAIEALHLAKYSAKVYIIYRQDSFKKMEKEMEERLKKNEKIEFIFNSEVIEYIGAKKIEKIKVLNNKTKEVTEMNMDGVFMAIGKLPTSEIFKDSKLEMDKLGYIITQPDSTKTNMKGIYACGDVANKKIKQAIFAAGQGCLAAMELQADYKIQLNTQKPNVFNPYSKIKKTQKTNNTYYRMHQSKQKIQLQIKRIPKK